MYPFFFFFLLLLLLFWYYCYIHIYIYLFISLQIILISIIRKAMIWCLPYKPRWFSHEGRAPKHRRYPKGGNMFFMATDHNRSKVLVQTIFKTFSNPEVGYWKQTTCISRVEIQLPILRRQEKKIRQEVSLVPGHGSVEARVCG